MDEYIKIKRSTLEKLCNSIREIKKQLDVVKQMHPAAKQYYTNEDIRQILQVNDKLIRKYRENGDLSYSQQGNRYWYSADDVEQFFDKCKIAY